jgi:hypothetical protein
MTTTIPITSASVRHLAGMAADATPGPAWAAVARGRSALSRGADSGG